MERVLSGVQPSGQIHLGNYITMKNFVELQNEKECYYCIVDLHSITVEQSPEELKKNSLELAALYIAIGLDPEKITLFLQSQVAAHAELAWILQCNSYVGELNRMTQYKEKSKSDDSNTVGLYTYPILMAADILLYNTNYVPVGSDQKQHLELTRKIARRFNNKYGETFTVPKPLIKKQGARIMSLKDPSNKMSKSSKQKGANIYLMDDLKTIKKKIMSAKTDSGREIKFDEENKPEISNLLTIYSECSNLSISEIEELYKGKGYGDFKKGLAEVVVNEIKPIQEKYHKILESGDINNILIEGAKKARLESNKILNDVKEKVGFITNL